MICLICQHEATAQMITAFTLTMSRPKYVGVVCLLCSVFGILIGYCLMDGAVTVTEDHLEVRAPRLAFLSQGKEESRLDQLVRAASHSNLEQEPSLKTGLLKEQEDISVQVAEKNLNNNNDDEEEEEEEETEEGEHEDNGDYSWLNDGVKLETPDTDPEETSDVDENGRRKRLPDCILIGERKTGTTALLHFLKSHPQIKAAPNEVHFFDLHRNFRLGLEWYRNQMTPTNDSEVTFEKSPRYFRTPWVPARIKQMNPRIKLLLSVRDPIRRAVSDFDFSREADWAAGFDKEAYDTFDEYVMAKGDGEVDGEFAPLQRSLYDVNMENWLKHFSLESFHILDGDSLAAGNPTEELQKIEKFLGLQPYFRKNLFFKDHKKGFYCLKEPGCLAFGGKPHAEVKPEVIRKLKEFFQPHNQRFYDLVGRDFGW